MAASRDRRASIIDDEAEDVDEVTLDASGETGLRKVQVSTWRLFEGLRTAAHAAGLGLGLDTACEPLARTLALPLALPLDLTLAPTLT